MNSDSIPKKIAATPASDFSKDGSVADLQTSQHRKMLITAQKMVDTFDALTTLKPEDEGELGFYADQLTQHFGADIQTLRSCITNAQQLADHMVKGSLR